MQGHLEMKQFRINLNNFTYTEVEISEFSEQELSYLDMLTKINSEILLNFDKSFFIAISFISIAGERLKVDLLKETEEIFENEKVFQFLHFLAQKYCCDLIQISVPVDLYSKINIPLNFYASNIVMGLDLEKQKNRRSKKVRFQQIDVSEIPIDDLAMRELEGRWSIPGSTVKDLDTYLELKKYYTNLLDRKQLSGYGLCDEGILIALNLWQEISPVNIVVGHYIWVSSDKRNEGLGLWLRVDRTNKLKKKGVKRIVSFLSIQNIAARAILEKSEFELNAIILNSEVFC